MKKSVRFQALFDPNLHRTSKIDWRGNAAKPGIAISVPPRYLPGKRMGTPTGSPFHHNLVAALQEPMDLFIAARTTICAPNHPTAPLRR
jgi:hypothetical protein